jgi:hypothetical protein
VRQKTVLWQLLGIHADGPRAIEAIHALDPKSHILPLLVVREVNRLEVEIGDSHKDPNPQWQERVEELAKSFDARAGKGKIYKPYVWDLAASHLYTMVGSARASNRCLERAAKRAPATPVVARQLRASQIYAFVQGLKTPSPANEARIARELDWLTQEKTGASRLNTLLGGVRLRLAELYRKKGDTLTAACLGGDGNDPIYQNEAQIAHMLAFIDKRDKTAFETSVVGLCPYKRDTLVQSQAMFALYHHGDFRTAAALLAKMPGPLLPADPFVIHIRDCHDCDAQAKDRQQYTTMQFIEHMMELLAQAKAQPTPEVYLEIANGFYNMSYYGNSRRIYEGAGADFANNPAINDTSRAEIYYQKALELTRDRELGAKAAFMASKCELAKFYQKHPTSKAAFRAGKWFHLLRDKYADTRYYQEIIRECGYFRTFAGGAAGGARRK